MIIEQRKWKKIDKMDYIKINEYFLQIAKLYTRYPILSFLQNLKISDLMEFFITH